MASTARDRKVSEPFVVSDEAGEALWFLDVLIDIKADADATNGAFSLVDHLAPSGYETPYHCHSAEDEVFYVLEGEIECLYGDAAAERSRAGPGDTVWLPKGVPHGFRVVSDEPCKILIALTPGGFEGFFRDAGTPAPSRTLPPRAEPDFDALVATAEPYGLDILGPLPE